MRKILTLICLVVLPCMLWAQCFTPREQRGDSFFAEKDYKAAKDWYEKAKTCMDLTNSDKSRLNGKIAKCNKLIKQPDDQPQTPQPTKPETEWVKTAYMQDPEISLEFYKDGDKLQIPAQDMDYFVPVVRYVPKDTVKDHVASLRLRVWQGTDLSRRPKSDVNLDCQVLHNKRETSLEQQKWNYGTGNFTIEITNRYNNTTLYKDVIEVLEKTISLQVNTSSGTPAENLLIGKGTPTKVYRYMVATNAESFQAVSTASDWCQIENITGNSFDVRVLENNGRDMRVADCRVTAGDKTVSFTVTQEGKSFFLTVDGYSTRMPDQTCRARGTRLYFPVKSNARWSVKGDNRWCRWNSAMSKDTLVLDIAPNDKASKREIEIQVVAMDGNGVEVDRLDMRIVQSGDLAIVKSLFIPGLGQMGRGQVGKGSAILVGEVVCAGTALITYASGKSKLKLMNSSIETGNYDDFMKASKSYKNLRAANYTFWSFAGALYVYNLVDAIVSKGKLNYKNSKISFAPVAAPTLEGPVFSMGFNFKF